MAPRDLRGALTAQEAILRVGRLDAELVTAQVHREQIDVPRPLGRREAAPDDARRDSPDQRPGEPHGRRRSGEYGRAAREQQEPGGTGMPGEAESGSHPHYYM